jgi:hypothetical protein
MKSVYIIIFIFLILWPYGCEKVTSSPSEIALKYSILEDTRDWINLASLIYPPDLERIRMNNLSFIRYADSMDSNLEKLADSLKFPFHGPEQARIRGLRKLLRNQAIDSLSCQEFFCLYAERTYPERDTIVCPSFPKTRSVLGLVEEGRDTVHVLIRTTLSDCNESSLRILTLVRHNMQWTVAMSDYNKYEYDSWIFGYSLGY